MALKAESKRRLGWNWLVEFDPIYRNDPTGWSVSPAFTEKENFDELVRRASGLKYDVDYVLMDDSTVMFRREEDALLIYLGTV